MFPFPIFNTSQKEPVPTATFFPLLNDKQCDDILDKFVLDKPTSAKVDRSKADPKKRDTLIHPIPHDEESQWLYELIVDRVSRYNFVGYQFDIAGVYIDLQLLEYPEGGFYDWHIDIGPGEAAYRKLSVILQLSDPDSYEGGEVIFNAGTERTLPKDRGQIAVFPSYILHKVTPITKGKRYALVCWCHGTRPFA